MSNIYKNYNPDILETIANLSNDEVFTPPKLANEILDLLPEEIWSAKKRKGAGSLNKKLEPKNVYFVSS